MTKSSARITAERESLLGLAAYERESPLGVTAYERESLLGAAAYERESLLGPSSRKKWLTQPLPAVEAAEKKGGEGAVGVEPAVRVLLPLFLGRLLKLGPARTLRGTFSPLAQATRARMVTC